MVKQKYIVTLGFPKDAVQAMEKPPELSRPKKGGKKKKHEQRAEAKFRRVACQLANLWSLYAFI